MVDCADGQRLLVSLEGETVHILDHDDGSGWVKVLTAQQGEGLVPAEYVSIQSGGENRMEAHAPGRALPPPASNHGAGMESTSSSSASLANQFGMGESGLLGGGNTLGVDFLHHNSGSAVRLHCDGRG